MTVGKIAEQGVTGRALDQCNDGGAVERPHDEIAFPVSGHRPVGYFRREIADRDDRPQHALGLGFCRSATRSSASAPRAQDAEDLLFEVAAALAEEGLVDGLVAHPHLEVLVVVHLQPGSDLGRRPAFGQTGLDLGGQRPVGRQLSHLGTTCRSGGPLVCSRRPVTVPSSAPADLAAHLRRRTPQPPRDLGERLTPRHYECDRLAFFCTQSLSRHPSPSDRRSQAGQFDHPTATTGGPRPASPELGDLQVDRPRPGVPAALTVAVPAVHPVLGALAVAGVAEHVDLGVHQQLGCHLHQLGE